MTFIEKILKYVWKSQGSLYLVNTEKLDIVRIGGIAFVPITDIVIASWN
jgi:hypothetical protein